MYGSMMVTVLVTQTANWVKLLGSISIGLLCVAGRFLGFVYGCVLDTIFRVPVIRVHGSHPLLSIPDAHIRDIHFLFSLSFPSLGRPSHKLKRSKVKAAAGEAGEKIFPALRNREYFFSLYFLAFKVRIRGAKALKK